jgi:aryl-alcohol dehydrogenase-like predicted oxidoreductase
MQYRLLGERTGLRVSQLALGTGMLGTANGYGAEPEEAARILGSYAEAGGNFIDTSDAYQLGQAENLVGEFIASRRDEFVIVSKYSRSASAQPPSTMVGNNRKVMVRAVEDSLRRLKTDRIDIYLPHFDDGITAAEETVRGLDDLVRAGKILYAGLSNFPAWRAGIAAALADLRGWTPIAVIQLEYSLVARAAERELLPMSAALGLGVMGYSPLGSGLLTGKYRKNQAGRATVLRGSVRDVDARTDCIIDATLAVAEQLGCSPSAVATAWVGTRHVVPIIGPRTHEQLVDNLSAVGIVLDAAHLRSLMKQARSNLDIHTIYSPVSAQSSVSWTLKLAGLPDVDFNHPKCTHGALLPDPLI